MAPFGFFGKLALAQVLKRKNMDDDDDGGGNGRLFDRAGEIECENKRESEERGEEYITRCPFDA